MSGTDAQRRALAAVAAGGVERALPPGYPWWWRCQPRGIRADVLDRCLAAGWIKVENPHRRYFAPVVLTDAGRRVIS